MNDPFTLLPANLGNLAAVAAHEDGRFALSGVQVTLDGGAYRVCATDGRHLALVTGPADADPLNYPTVPELTEAPPSEGQAVIPAKEWKEAFKAAPKGKAVAEQPILGHVAVHLGKQTSVLASADLEQTRVRRINNLGD